MPEENARHAPRRLRNGLGTSRARGRPAFDSHARLISDPRLHFLSAVSNDLVLVGADDRNGIDRGIDRPNEAPIARKGNRARIRRHAGPFVVVVVVVGITFVVVVRSHRADPDAVVIRAARLRLLASASELRRRQRWQEYGEAEFPQLISRTKPSQRQQPGLDSM